MAEAGSRQTAVGGHVLQTIPKAGEAHKPPDGDAVLLLLKPSHTAALAGWFPYRLDGTTTCGIFNVAELYDVACDDAWCPFGWNDSIGINTFPGILRRLGW